jgi:hypothetical protein
VVLLVMVESVTNSLYNRPLWQYSLASALGLECCFCGLLAIGSAACWH